MLVPVTCVADTGQPEHRHGPVSTDWMRLARPAPRDPGLHRASARSPQLCVGVALAPKGKICRTPSLPTVRNASYVVTTGKIIICSN